MFSASKTKQVSSGTANYIEQVFSTYLYTGNGSSQSITNGISLGPSYSGVSGGSANFVAASTQYCTVPNNTAFDFGSGNFTIEAFVYPTAGNTTAVAYKGSGSTYAPFGLTVYPNGGVVLYGSTTGTTWEISASNNCSIPTNTWTHIAAVRNGSSFTVYINGAAGPSVTNASSLVSNTQAVGLGACNDGTYCASGKISNLRIVRGTAVYTSNFTPPSSALTAIAGTSLLCFQGSTPFVDNSGNSFSITQVNTPTASTVGPFPQVAGSGGLVWMKDRVNGTLWHQLFDTSRGGNNSLASNVTDAQYNLGGNPRGVTFNGTGFTINDTYNVNVSGDNSVSWTFRKQAKFFDIVTYTGNGTTQAISHNLGSTPGCIILKCTSSSSYNWPVWHTSLTAGYELYLNTTGAAVNGGANEFGNNTSYVAPTSTNFTVGNNGDVNQNGQTYVAYLFASNAGGFGLTGTDNVISCGSFTTDASGNATINLGWEPQWILSRDSAVVDNWTIEDNMRGLTSTSGGGNKSLNPNSSAAEGTAGYDGINATGFSISSWGANRTRIYIAIRRGPMQVPTSGTSVFAPVKETTTTNPQTVTTNFPVDLTINTIRTGASEYFVDRLRGQSVYLCSTDTNAEGPASGLKFDNNTGIVDAGWWDNVNAIFWNFRRAPNFFDEVCYTGTGGAGTQNHNLGVPPEFVILKRRDSTQNWYGYTPTSVGFLNTNGAFSATTNTMTSTTFSLQSNIVGATYVAYLFATCPGVSKVGTYTGTGATQTISCGFTGGARWVMIKRTDSTGDWYVWDTARGMVAGTDPYLLLDTTAAEVNANNVYTTTGGFQIVSSLADINANGGSYIFLAVS